MDNSTKGGIAFAVIMVVLLAAWVGAMAGTHHLPITAESC